MWMSNYHTPLLHQLLSTQSFGEAVASRYRRLCLYLAENLDPKKATMSTEEESASLTQQSTELYYFKKSFYCFIKSP